MTAGVAGVGMPRASRRYRTTFYDCARSWNGVDHRGLHPPGDARSRCATASASSRRAFDLDYWTRCDAEKRWPDEVWDELGAGGWLGLAIPEQYGGGGAGLLELAVACETLAASGAGSAASFLYLLTPTFGAFTVAAHGAEQQKRDLLPGMANGSIADLLRADRAGRRQQLVRHHHPGPPRGRRLRAPGAEDLDLRRAAGRLDARGLPHRHAGRGAGPHRRLQRPAGRRAGGGRRRARCATTRSRRWARTRSRRTWCSSTTCGSRATGCSARSTSGFRVLWDILNPERIVAAAGAVGGADLALRVACGYARERTVFGRPIGANQAVVVPARPGQGADRAGPADDLQGRVDPRRRAALRRRRRHREARRRRGVLGGRRPRLPDLRRHGLLRGVPGGAPVRDARIGTVIPVAEELLLNYLATQVLGLPRSF